MKNILNTIWTFANKYAGYVFLAFILMVMFSLALQKCNDTTEFVDEIDLNKYRMELLDSIAKANHAKTIAVIDSLNFIRQAEISKYDKKVQTLSKAVNTLKSELNTLKEKPFESLAECEQVVEKQNEVITKQDTVIITQDSTITLHEITISDLNKKFELEKAEKIRINGMYDDCIVDNNKLIKALDKKDNWWTRNEKWVYLGAGALAGILIAK